ncbi:MAG TPA: hypothetical protein VH352_21600 [Pseudonocardiaceae bacterium]|nr:hypothetical protein [Pseudonocardiaceae bacterium]
MNRNRIRHVVAAAALAVLTATGLVVAQVPASADNGGVGVALTVSQTTVIPGDTVTVTETITNTNGFTILQPTVRLLSTPDVITGYTTLAGCNAGTNGTCTTLSNGYEAILGAAISGNSSATVTFTLTVNPSDASAVETLEGQLVATNFISNVTPGPTLTIIAQADLGVTLTGTPDPGLLSMNLDFAVKVTNNGPGRLLNATYTGTVPDGLSVRSTSTCAASNEHAICTFGALAPGASATAKFIVPVGLLDIGIPFTFSVARTTSTPNDPNPANDTSSTTCTVVSVLLASCG